MSFKAWCIASIVTFAGTCSIASFRPGENFAALSTGVAALAAFVIRWKCNAFLYFALSTEFNFVVRRAMKGFASLQVGQRHIDDLRAMLLDALQHGACMFESLLLIVVWKDEECDVQGPGSDDAREE